MVIAFLFTIVSGSVAKHFSDGGDTKIVCEKYACGSVPGNYCMGKGKDFLYAEECPLGTYCSSEAVCRKIREKYQAIESYPGEKCSHEIPCRYGNCIEGICRGLGIGESCSDHFQCEPGLRCHHTCKKLFKHKERGCISDYDCESGSGCNFGECTSYLSLEPGELVEKCEDFSSLLCQYAMCDNGKCLDEQKFDEYPRECSSDKDCMSGDGYFAKCVCGLNESGKSFCLPFPGDNVGKEYFGLISKWIGSNDIEKCNTKRRFTLHCMSSNWKESFNIEYLYKSYRYNYFPSIIENPTCVEKSLTQDYWQIREIFKNTGKNYNLRNSLFYLPVFSSKEIEEM